MVALISQHTHATVQKASCSFLVAWVGMTQCYSPAVCTAYLLVCANCGYLRRRHSMNSMGPTGCADRVRLLKRCLDATVSPWLGSLRGLVEGL